MDIMYVILMRLHVAQVDKTMKDMRKKIICYNKKKNKA